MKTTLASALLAAILLAWPIDSVHAQQQSCLSKRGKIVGGERADAAQWPGQVALRLHSEGGRVSFYFCGGTSISDRWVLTAAHCMADYISEVTGSLRDSKGKLHQGRLEVVLGASDLTRVRADQVIAVERVVVHEQYRGAIEKAWLIANPADRQQALTQIAMNVGNDIALLRLATPWTGATAGLSLSGDTDPPTFGSQVRVAGYGTTGPNRDKDEPDFIERADGQGEFLVGSPRLLETAVETIATPRCAARYSGKVIGAGQICAGLEQGGKDSCQGDSGGPLITTDARGCPWQIGVVSWGEGCAEKEAYGVYTRVSHFSSWIQEHTGPLRGAPPRQGPNAGNTLTVAQLKEGLRQLETLLGSTKELIRIGVRGGDRVKLKDKVVFEASSDVAGRLLILDINANREVMMLYPNRYVASGDIARIGAGQRVTVPGPEYPRFTSFEAQEPVGKGHLLALVLPEDFEIERFAAPQAVLKKGFAPVDDPPSYLMHIIRQIETALKVRRAGNASAGDELKSCGYAIAEYEIVR